MAKRRKKPKQRAPQPIRERRPKLRGPSYDAKPHAILQMFEVDPGPWGYGLLLIAAFGWLLWANGDLRDGEKTLQWRETIGTIAETSVSKTTSGGASGNSSRPGGQSTSSSSTWHVAVSYRYEVAGQAYSGHRIGWSGGWSYSSSSEAHEKAREVKARKTIPVFYDPMRPSEALLVRGGHPGNLVIGVLMIGVAVAFLIYSHLKRRPNLNHLPAKKRRGPRIRRALLGGFAAAIVVGGLQYLLYVKQFSQFS